MEHKLYNIPQICSPACANCTNNIANGGSGICHCILGSMQIGDLQSDNYYTHNPVTTSVTTSSFIFIGEKGEK